MFTGKAIITSEPHRVRAGRGSLARRGRFSFTAAVFSLSITLSLGPLLGAVRPGGEFNGFDVSNSLVPIAEIRSGGPPRDGIPSIDRPRFAGARSARNLQPDDLVVSVTLGGRTRAYPLRILVYHEIVNDQFGGQALAITYCPLCGTAMVFDRVINGRRLDFGVSGLLFWSSLLMYDRQTESLWSQVGMQAIAGPQAGVHLTLVASEHLTWAAWRARYPTGEVLMADLGSRRDYSRNPYADYERHEALGYPVPRNRTELPNKEWVVGVLVNGQPAAYPLRALATTGSARQTVGGTLIEVASDPVSQGVTVTEVTSGQALPFVKLYWFAWQAFHPQTFLWHP